MKIRHCEPHGPLRAAEYPSIGDQLDALFKLAEAMRTQGMQMPPNVSAWIDQCRAVKDKYKPSHPCHAHPPSRVFFRPSERRLHAPKDSTYET